LRLESGGRTGCKRQTRCPVPGTAPTIHPPPHSSTANTRSAPCSADARRMGCGAASEMPKSGPCRRAPVHRWRRPYPRSAGRDRPGECSKGRCIGAQPPQAALVTHSSARHRACKQTAQIAELAGDDVAIAPAGDGIGDELHPPPSCAAQANHQNLQFPEFAGLHDLFLPLSVGRPRRSAGIGQGGCMKRRQPHAGR
jgi:hypothetical protein